MLDLSQQYGFLAGPIQREIDEVLRSQQFILGSKVEEFERALSGYTGARFTIGVSSGTDALLALFMALGIGSEHAVITTAYSFFGTAGSIARVGATPTFVDIDPATFNLSADALQHFLQHRCEHTSTAPIYRAKRIRAVVPVHLFGLCCEMDPIRTVRIGSSCRFSKTRLKQSAQNTPLHPVREKPAR